MKISTKLKNWRKANHWSQAAAAQRLAISPRTLQEWEQDRRHPRGLALQALRRIILPSHRTERRRA